MDAATKHSGWPKKMHQLGTDKANCFAIQQIAEEMHSWPNPYCLKRRLTLTTCLCTNQSNCICKTDARSWHPPSFKQKIFWLITAVKGLSLGDSKTGTGTKGKLWGLNYNPWGLKYNPWWPNYNPWGLNYNPWGLNYNPLRPTCNMCMYGSWWWHFFC